jgi:hypothetical protein
MKGSVSGYAIAGETFVTEDGVEMQVYTHEYGGSFALDGSYIEQVLTEDPCYIPDPLNAGRVVQLVDSVEEIKDDVVIGLEHDDPTKDQVISLITKALDCGDRTTLDALLDYVPLSVLHDFIKE